MSLESDIQFLPRRLATWGPVQKLMTRLARAGGIITGDESLNVFQTPTGWSIQSTTATAAGTDLADDPFQCAINGGVVSATGGVIRFQGANTQTVEAVDLVLEPGSYICVRVEIDLTAAGDALTARHEEGLTWTTEVTLLSTPAIVSVSASQMFDAAYVMPGSVSEGAFYVPIAYITPGRQLQQWWHGASYIDVDLYHDHFTISYY